jgi:hypothetical protein
VSEILDTALDCAGYLDWITPLISLNQGSLVTTFRVHSSSASLVIAALEGAGVWIMNPSFLPGQFVFDVPWDEADYAELIIESL